MTETQTRPEEKVPQWFRDIMAVPYEEYNMTLDGHPLHYLQWGDKNRPPVILLHGFVAHAQWWRFVAGYLARDWCVIAPDLSGHGDSGHRDTYSDELWAEEVLAITDHAGIRSQPIVIGHSMGGYVALSIAALHPHYAAGVIIADTSLRQQATGQPSLLQSEKEFARPPATVRRVYPDIATGMSRFRWMPPQPCATPYIQQHIAQHSLKEIEEGWSWKFDPSMWGRRSRKPTLDYIECLAAPETPPIAVIKGEHSLVVDTDTLEYRRLLEITGTSIVEVPDAHHHLFVDQPLAFVTGLRSILVQWGWATMVKEKTQEESDLTGEKMLDSAT